MAAADDAGQALEEFLVLVDGNPAESDGDHRRLRGVSTGSHRVIVTAPGRLAWIEDLDLADGATTLVRAVLPRR